MKNAIKLLSIIGLLAAATPGFSIKPFPHGIVDLPGSISDKKPIGEIADHPWLNATVAGVRIRTGWDNTEPVDGIYNWAQIDESLARATTSKKYIGLGVTAGITAPAWLMGGVTFLDGVSVLGSKTLTSATAKFATTDVGRIILSDSYPAGTKISSRTSATSVKLSEGAIKSSTLKKPLSFSILQRNSGGAAFRVLTAPDEGVMVVPWDPLAKTKWKEFVVALGIKYDNKPQLGYVVMTGFQQIAECYLAVTQADINFFDASAVAAGYKATATLPAGLVAWEATAKEMVAQFMFSFPNTPLLITGARPYGGDSQTVGQIAMQDIFDWGAATYPGRFGIMNSQLHASSTLGYFLNSAINDVRSNTPVGIQFLCAGTSDNPDNIKRLSNSTPFGDDPLLSIYDAVNVSASMGVSFGCNFIEVYEADINNPALKKLLSQQKRALGF
ncbi:MAG: hypothetical protein ABI787_07760 [Spartobacteria bacterium]